MTWFTSASPTRSLAILSFGALLFAYAPSARAQACKPDTAGKKSDPFAFADWTWLNGNPRTTDSPLKTDNFTGEFRADASFIEDFNHPTDHTLVGTSESGRTSELQVQQLGIGGDFTCGAVRGRFMTQLGMYSTMTPRNDASTGRGQWQLDNAYRYLSEAYGGRHWNAMHGINLDAGIFLSYVGLFSYYNFDNWAYQPSYVSSNTPWYFTGIRLQFYPTEHLKIEPWIINGWQSYGMFNSAPGVGAQILWRPNGKVSALTNDYYGHDWLGIPDRWRGHTDNSIQVKFYEDSTRTLNRSAFSLTVDAGCESGSGVSCTGGVDPQQSFVGLHAVQPQLVCKGPVWPDAWRRRHEQPGTVPRAAAADQRGNRVHGITLLQRQPR